jgi:hypothetical protein
MVADPIHAAFAILTGLFIPVMLDLSRIRFLDKVVMGIHPGTFSMSHAQMLEQTMAEIQPLNPTRLPYLVPYKR